MEFSLAFIPRADVIHSPKQGYKWPYKKDRCHYILFCEKKKIGLFLSFENKTSVNMMSSAAGVDRNYFIFNEED